MFSKVLCAHLENRAYHATFTNFKLPATLAWNTPFYSITLSPHFFKCGYVTKLQLKPFIPLPLQLFSDTSSLEVACLFSLHMIAKPFFFLISVDDEQVISHTNAETQLRITAVVMQSNNQWQLVSVY